MVNILNSVETAINLYNDAAEAVANSSVSIFIAEQTLSALEGDSENPIIQNQIGGAIKALNAAVIENIHAQSELMRAEKLLDIAVKLAEIKIYDSQNSRG